MKKYILSLLAIPLLAFEAVAYPGEYGGRTGSEGQGWVGVEFVNGSLDWTGCHIPYYTGDSWERHDSASNDWLEIDMEYMMIYVSTTGQACECGGSGSVTAYGWLTDSSDDDYPVYASISISTSPANDSGYDEAANIVELYLYAAFDIEEELCGSGLYGINWHSTAFASIY